MAAKRPIIFFVVLFLFIHVAVFAQKDTTATIAPGIVLKGKVIDNSKDSTKNQAKKYNPNKAVIRSAVLPGWGQITNKKYWKLPLVYGAIGITTGIFIHNIKQYKEAKEAYILAADGDASNDYLIKQPYYSVKDQPERIRNFRNEVRQNVDYSALFILVFWGLNVADAAVDAHLKTFDVSDDLGVEIKAGYSPLAQTNGISLVMHIGK